jgi:hypothetical protein
MQSNHPIIPEYTDIIKHKYFATIDLDYSDPERQRNSYV